MTTKYLPLHVGPTLPHQPIHLNIKNIFKSQKYHVGGGLVVVVVVLVVVDKDESVELETNLATARRPLGEAPLHAGAPGTLPISRNTRDVPLHLKHSQNWSQFLPGLGNTRKYMLDH